MTFPADVWLPSEAELIMPEMKLTSGPLMAAAHHLGKFCDNQCKEFMLCWYETKDPRACLKEGKEVTECGLKFFEKVKAHCADDFMNYYLCLERRAGTQMPLQPTQLPFDECIQHHLKQERPEVGYFSKVRLHHSARPRYQPNPAPMPEAIPDNPSFKDTPLPVSKEWFREAVRKPSFTGPGV